MILTLPKELLTFIFSSYLDGKTLCFLTYANAFFAVFIKTNPYFSSLITLRHICLKTDVLSRLLRTNVMDSLNVDTHFRGFLKLAEKLSLCEFWNVSAFSIPKRILLSSKNRHLKRILDIIKLSFCTLENCSKSLSTIAQLITQNVKRDIINTI